MDRNRWDEELDLVLSSEAFAKAHRTRGLLRWLAAQVLECNQHRLNEYDVAQEVFHQADHDPSVNSNVRKQMGRLRSRLDQFYATTGRTRPMRLRLSGFVPEIVPNAVSPAPPPTQLLIEPFESRHVLLDPLAQRLTEEVAHHLFASHQIEVVWLPRGQRRTASCLSGSVNQSGVHYVIFARVTGSDGIITASYRGEHYNVDPAGWAVSLAQQLVTPQANRSLTSRNGITLVPAAGST